MTQSRKRKIAPLVSSFGLLLFSLMLVVISVTSEQSLKAQQDKRQQMTAKKDAVSDTKRLELLLDSVANLNKQIDSASVSIKQKERKLNTQQKAIVTQTAEIVKRKQ